MCKIAYQKRISVETKYTQPRNVVYLQNIPMNSVLLLIAEWVQLHDFLKANGEAFQMFDILHGNSKGIPLPSYTRIITVHPTAVVKQYQINLDIENLIEDISISNSPSLGPWLMGRYNSPDKPTICTSACFPIQWIRGMYK